MDTKEPYSLGQNAEDLYGVLAAKRQQVIDMGRRMAELTIPSVFPPDQYKAGDELPGNNQSVGAQAVNNLASKLMFMAFPPGQPMLRFVPVETKLREQIDADPHLYARTNLALSRLEMEHRSRASATALRTAYTGYIKLLLVGGNALWKYLQIDNPTYHAPTHYVVIRAANGHPLVTIHKETFLLETLDAETLEVIKAKTPELFADNDDGKGAWERTADLYSVCRLVGSPTDTKEGRHWEFWVEYKGEVIDGTEFEADYDVPPMWPGWLIPVYGDNWGRSYCEEYRGDLYALEANASSLNDGAALAAWALPFVKPGGLTSIRQVQKADNLTILSGSADDLSVFRSEKIADFRFVQETFSGAARRVSAAFLLQAAIQREGERVTAEEVSRLGQELDTAMGGLYTQIAYDHQRPIIRRFVRLHEDENEDLPVLPEGLVRVEVTTGTDAMGRSHEVTGLRTFAADMKQTFPDEPGLIDPLDYGNRLGSALGVRTEGLMPTREQREQRMAQQQQNAAGMALLDKGTGPAVKGIADMAAQAATPQPQPTGT